MSDNLAGASPSPSPSRLLALAMYLPQFHRIAENDSWWEPGFTEWTHLRRARTYFPGHSIRQPAPPLGQYDLLDTATMQAQYRLASSHGLDGFLVWDYWLGGGRRLLERPLARVLAAGLDFRYAIAWANHSWTDQLRRRTLAKQQYLGADDYAAYFENCLPHFRSKNYIFVDGKPLFFVYRPEDIPDLEVFLETWQKLARASGFAGIYMIGDFRSWHSCTSISFDAVSCGFGFWTNRKKLYINFAKEKLRTKLGIQTSPQRYDFSTMLQGFVPEHPERRFVPTVLTGWDTTPRHGRNGVVFEGLTPASFRQHLEQAGRLLLQQESRHPMLLVKSWNEWAEGNLLEPDSVHGDTLLREFAEFSKTLRAELGK